MAAKASDDESRLPCPKQHQEALAQTDDGLRKKIAGNSIVAVSPSGFLITESSRSNLLVPATFRSRIDHSAVAAPQRTPWSSGFLVLGNTGSEQAFPGNPCCRSTLTLEMISVERQVLMFQCRPNLLMRALDMGEPACIFIQRAANRQPVYEKPRALEMESSLRPSIVVPIRKSSAPNMRQDG